MIVRKIRELARNVFNRRRSPAHLDQHNPPPPDGKINYPGDYSGPLTPVYRPVNDTHPDPGEVVWTWVPFQEDYSQGKDRPVLIVGKDSPWLLALPLSSKNHALDRDQEASEGRFWVEIGPGPWDKSGHGSSVRVNRVLRVEEKNVRRMGGHITPATFTLVAQGVSAHYR